MREYKEKTETKKYTVLSKVACDFCGKQGKSADFDGIVSWANNFDVDQTCISRKTGRLCPDGGAGNNYWVDICPECFQNKLIPWLESQGIKMYSGKWDW